MATKDWRDNSLTDGDDITSIDVVEFLSLIEQFESGVIQDVDGDTKIQVEESSDEDKIRFDTGGIERAVLDSSGLNLASGLTYNINGIAHNHDTSYIAKPSTPSHLDLLAFITNDWAKVAQSWASGDLLFVNDNSGTLEWKRLPKGSDGQVLKLSSGIPSWGTDSGNLFFARYGYTYITPMTELDTPLQIINDATEYTTTGTADTWISVKTWTLNSSLNAELTPNDRYTLTWETELKISSSVPYCYAYATLNTSSLGTPTPTYSEATTSYVTYGGISSTVTPYTKFNYGATLALYLKYNGVNRYPYSRNNKVWVTHKAIGVPQTITPTWLSENGFSGIKYIELYDSGDTVILNDDSANMTFTGVSGQPTALFDSTNYTQFSPEDYEDITKVYVNSGNPLIVFEKA